MQQQFKKIAISGAISALLMGAGVAEAHVSYNSGPSKNNNPSALWTGGAPTYTGKLPTNWVANVHNDMDPNASYTVSTADALSEGAPGTYTVKSHNNKWKPGASWGAALGFGIIDMHDAGNLTIEVKADAGSLFTPGFTVFSGWDAGTTSSKHQAWNNTGDVTNPDTLGSTDLTYIGHSSTTTVGGTTTLFLSNLAAGEYSIWIGGNDSGSTSGTNQNYIATITASPVPVPAAAWLMGTGLLGLVGMRRKKVTA